MRLTIALAATLLVACGPVSERRPLDELHPRVDDDELPPSMEREPMELEVTVAEGVAPAVRTLIIEKTSWSHVPVEELRLCRMERRHEPDLGWPDGWELVNGTVPFGDPFEGLQPGVRYRDLLHIVRTSEDAPRELTIRWWYPVPGDDSYGGARLAESDWVRVAFDGVAETLTEQHFEASSDLWFAVTRSRVGDAYRTFSIQPGGMWQSATAYGHLDEPSLAAFRDVLRQASVWTLLDGEDVETSSTPPVPVQTTFFVAVIHGDGFRRRRISEQAFRTDVGWKAIREEIDRLTGEDPLR